MVRAAITTGKGKPASDATFQARTPFAWTATATCTSSNGCPTPARAASATRPSKAETSDANARAARRPLVPRLDLNGKPCPFAVAPDWRTYQHAH